MLIKNFISLIVMQISCLKAVSYFYPTTFMKIKQSSNQFNETDITLSDNGLQIIQKANKSEVSYLLFSRYLFKSKCHFLCSVRNCRIKGLRKYNQRHILKGINRNLVNHFLRPFQTRILYF